MRLNALDEHSLMQKRLPACRWSKQFQLRVCVRFSNRYYSLFGDYCVGERWDDRITVSVCFRRECKVHHYNRRRAVKFVCREIVQESLQRNTTQLPGRALRISVGIISAADSTRSREQDVWFYLVSTWFDVCVHVCLCVLACLVHTVTRRERKARQPY